MNDIYYAVHLKNNNQMSESGKHDRLENDVMVCVCENQVENTVFKKHTIDLFICLVTGMSFLGMCVWMWGLFVSEFCLVMVSLRLFSGVEGWGGGGVQHFITCHAITVQQSEKPTTIT